MAGITKYPQPIRHPHAARKTCGHRVYGMSCEDLNALYERASHACEICREPERPYVLNIDHEPFAALLAGQLEEGCGSCGGVGENYYVTEHADVARTCTTCGGHGEYPTDAGHNLLMFLKQYGVQVSHLDSQDDEAEEFDDDDPEPESASEDYVRGLVARYDAILAVIRSVKDELPEDARQQIAHILDGTARTAVGEPVF